MIIWPQKPASIQPRTSLSKFADAYMHHPPPVVSSALRQPLDQLEDRLALLLELVLGDELVVEQLLEVLEALLRPGVGPGGSVIIIIGSVHGERENFTRLVLGCIEAKFCK